MILNSKVKKVSAIDKFINEVFQSIANWLAGLITAAFDWITTSITDQLYTNEIFKIYFPIFYQNTTKQLILGIGIGIASVLFLIGLVSVMRKNSQQSPFDVIEQFLFSCGFLIICKYFTDEVWSLLTPLMKMAAKLENTSNVSALGQSFFNLVIKVEHPSLTVFMILVATIMLIILLIEYFKFILEIFERYIVTNVLLIVSPIAAGFYAFKETKDVWGKYLMMIVSTSLIMCFNIIYIKGFSSAMAYMVTSVPSENAATNLLLCFVILLGYLKIGQRIDKIFDQMGLTTVQTGGAIARTIGGAAIAGIGAARAARNSAGRAYGSNVSSSGFNANAMGGSKNVSKILDQNPSLKAAAGNTRNAITNPSNPFHGFGSDKTALNAQEMGFAMSHISSNDPMIGEKASNTISNNFGKYEGVAWNTSASEMGGGKFSGQIENADGSSYGVEISQSPFSGASELKDNEGNSYWAKETPIDGPIGGFTNDESNIMSISDRFGNDQIADMGYGSDCSLTYNQDGTYTVSDRYGNDIGTISSNDWSDFNNAGATGTGYEDFRGNSYSSIKTGSDFDTLMGANDTDRMSDYSNYASNYGVTPSGIFTDTASAQSASADTARQVLSNSNFEAATGMNLSNSHIDTSTYANTGQFTVTQNDSTGNPIKSVNVGLASRYEGVQTVTINATGHNGAKLNASGTTFAIQNNTITSDGATKNPHKKVIVNPLKHKGKKKSTATRKSTHK